MKLTLDGKEHEVSIARRRPHLVLLIDGIEVEVSHLPGLGDGRKAMSVDGTDVRFARAAAGAQQIVRLDGRSFDVGIVDQFSAAGGGGTGQDALRAPMPGAVISIHSEVGATVKRGQILVTIESMKLQTALPAPRDGIVAAIMKADGQTFEKDETLVKLEPETEDA